MRGRNGWLTQGEGEGERGECQLNVADQRGELPALISQVQRAVCQFEEGRWFAFRVVNRTEFQLLLSGGVSK